jgi:hypothetical protein
VRAGASHCQPDQQPADRAPVRSAFREAEWARIDALFGKVRHGESLESWDQFLARLIVAGLEIEERAR